MASSSSSRPSKSKQLTQEQIANGFNELRNQQRQLVTKISEITDERKEYQYVVETSAPILMTVNILTECMLCFEVGDGNAQRCGQGSNLLQIDWWSTCAEDSW